MWSLIFLLFFNLVPSHFFDIDLTKNTIVTQMVQCGAHVDAHGTIYATLAIYNIRIRFEKNK